jgi:chemotaxis family two-component system sensor kinase Cph1
VNKGYTSKSALAFSLAIHELATNAAKYGALSKPGGRVSIHWAKMEDGGLELSWTELGSPSVSAPNRRGFGSTLIERALAMETDGTAVICYLPGGVVCDVALPPASLAPFDAATVVPSAITFSNVRAETKRAGNDIPVLVVDDSFMIIKALELAFDSDGWTMLGPATRIPKALALVKCLGMSPRLCRRVAFHLYLVQVMKSLPCPLTFYAEARASRKSFKLEELERSILQII